MLKNIFTAVIVKQNLSPTNAMSLIGSRDLFIFIKVVAIKNRQSTDGNIGNKTEQRHTKQTEQINVTEKPKSQSRIDNPEKEQRHSKHKHNKEN
jgi:hypothetical protein